MAHDPRALEPVPRCRFCGRQIPNGRAGRPEPVCDLAACRGNLARETADRTARQRWSETLRRSREQIGAAAGAVVAGARELQRHVEDVVPVAIPLMARHMVPQSVGDRRMITNHLDRIVAASFQSGAPDPVTPDRTELEAPTSAYVSAACATCKGACCAVGRDHRAFLSAETITQFRRHQPDLSPGQIRDRYLSRLPDRIVAGSCFFHGAAGCTLDREQRDDVCHKHFCAQLRAQHDAGVAALPGPFVIVAADEVGNRAVALFDPDQRPRPLTVETGGGPDHEAAERIVEQAFAQFPMEPPALRHNDPPPRPLCAWCSRPIAPAQAALSGSCGQPSCERARRKGG